MRIIGLRDLRSGTLDVRGNSLSFGSYLVAGGNFGAESPKRKTADFSMKSAANFGCGGRI